MRRAAQLLLVFLLSAVVTVGIASLLGVDVGGLGERLRAGADGGLPVTQLPDTVADLRQKQDEYLRVLLDHPADAAAMRGLIAVRRRLAGDDPVVLRRQATAYQQIITSGAESPEHYSRKSMELLASASVRAAAAVESDQRTIAQRATRATAPAPGSAPPNKGAVTPPALPSTPGQPNTGNAPVSAPAQPAPSKSPIPAAPAQPPQTGPAAAPSTPPPATGQPGAPAAPQQPAGHPTAPSPPPSTTPAPPPPPAPPVGSTTPQQPAGQTVPPPGPPEGTIAVVTPQPAGPEVTQSEGSLAKIDCQKKAFVLHGSNGDEEYLTAQNFTIYIRGTGSERLSDFCGLQRHVGRAAMVWWVPDGDRKIAKSMSVVLPAQ